MKRALERLTVAGALTCAVLAGPAPSRAGETEPPAPYLAVRALEALQDRITTGDAVAGAARAKAVARAAADFARTKPAAWGDLRNARALALYLFSGGNATAVADAVPREAVARDAQALFDGALAYGLGHDDDARDKLAGIDARSLPSGLGGHLALVQANLLAASDKAKAIELLDLARLLEPGTLVEEAALRKELMLLGADEKGVAKFVTLTRRYAGTFRRSLYADNFRQLVRAAAFQIGAADSAAAGAHLVALLGGLDAGDRRRLLLAIARDALVAGRLAMAAYASEEAARLPGTTDREEARARLYLGAATIVGTRYEAGRKALATASAAKLDEGDQALRLSALAVADTIRDPSFAARPDAGAGQAVVVTDGERALGAAAAALKAVDRAGAR